MVKNDTVYGAIRYFLKYAQYQQVVDFTDRVSWLFRFRPGKCSRVYVLTSAPHLAQRYCFRTQRCGFRLIIRGC